MPHSARSRRKAARARTAPGDATNRNQTRAAMRKTGLRIVETMPWGAHICLFYDRKEDLLETCVAYFKEGLKADEFCIWAVSEPAREEDAKRALRDAIPGFDRYLAKGQFELLSGRDWYLEGDEFDMQRISGGWHKKLTAALRKGYSGMRASGNAFWIESNHWKEFTAYEYELDRALAGKKMIVLCTYPLCASRAVDLMDVARAHHLSLAQRNGRMEFLETPDLKHAKREIERLNYALDVLSRPSLVRYQLTARERAALAQIVHGASSKEAGRVLGISPRTVEFHRANIMRKLGAKNAADLVRKILAD